MVTRDELAAALRESADGGVASYVGGWCVRVTYVSEGCWLASLVNEVGESAFRYAESPGEAAGPLWGCVLALEHPDLSPASSVHDWYVTAFPADPEGGRVGRGLTFGSLWERMRDGDPFYELLGAGDSVVRERVFRQMSRVLRVPMDRIYAEWR